MKKIVDLKKIRVIPARYEEYNASSNYGGDSPIVTVDAQMVKLSDLEACPDALDISDMIKP